MPVKGLTTRRRMLRTLTVRLGVTDTKLRRDGSKVEYPKEVDFFVLKREDGATDEILDAYPHDPKTGRVTKRLRMMIPEEYDTLDEFGGEYCLNRLNRAYTGNGIRCVGTGGDGAENAATATCFDAKWAERIGHATHSKPRSLGRGGDGRERWEVTCHGPACVKYLVGTKAETVAAGHDADAGCRMTVVLRGILLHPTTDRSSDDYMRHLAWVQVASGSYHTLMDTQSGFEALREFTGRTRMLPFWLRRQPRKTYRGAATVHWPCLVEFDPEEVQLIAMAPPRQALLQPAVRRELLALAAAPVEFEDVRDLRPASQHPRIDDAHRPRLTAGEQPSSSGGAGMVAPAPPPGDRDEVVEQAAGATADEPADVVDADVDPDDEPDSDPALTRRLSQDERNELKRLVGIAGDDDPEKAAKLARLRELAAAAYRHFGDEPDGTQLLGALEVRHRNFIRDRIAAQSDPAEEWLSS